MRCLLAHCAASYATFLVSLLIAVAARANGSPGEYLCAFIGAPLEVVALAIISVFNGGSVFHGGDNPLVLVAFWAFYGAAFWIILRRLHRAALPPELRYPPGRCWRCGYGPEPHPGPLPRVWVIPLPRDEGPPGRRSGGGLGTDGGK